MYITPIGQRFYGMFQGWQATGEGVLIDENGKIIVEGIFKANYIKVGGNITKLFNL